MTVVLAQETTPLLSSEQRQFNSDKKKATIWHMLIPLLILGFCAV
jgi:hypothetical protein